MMYADSGVFVLALAADARLPQVADAVRFIRAVGRGDRSLSTATLTWDEVTYVVRRLAGPPLSAAKGQELLAVPNIAWLAVDEAVVRRAAQLYGTVPIRPRRAIHAACALENEETDIVSEDVAFDQVPGLNRAWPPP